MNPVAYTLARLVVGLSMFGHGLVRLPKLAAFSHWMVEKFATSMLPSALVTPFSYILPIVELTTGALLILGLFTRVAAIAGCLAMCALIFGSTLIENFDALPSQMIHGLFFIGLLHFITANTWSMDRLLARRS